MFMSKENKTGSRMTYGLLVLSTLAALLFCLFQAHQNRRMSRIISSYGGALSGPAKAMVGDIVPEFVAANLEGARETITYSGEDSKCRVFQIFSPYCKACEVQLRDWWPLLQREQVGESVDMFSLSIGELDDTRVFSGVDSVNTLLMPSDAVRRAYRVTAVPETILVSPEGIVEWSYYGVLDTDRYANLVQSITECSATKTASWGPKDKEVGNT